MFSRVFIEVGRSRAYVHAEITYADLCLSCPDILTGTIYLLNIGVNQDYAVGIFARYAAELLSSQSQHGFNNTQDDLKIRDGGNEDSI